MYRSTCPKCGGEVRDVVELDIVTEQFCANKKCSWYKRYGSLGFQDGESYLDIDPYDHHYDWEEDYSTESDFPEEDEECITQIELPEDFDFGDIPF